MSHMRNEDADAVRDSILELVAAAGPARAHVSHLKMVYGKGEAAAEGLLEFIRTLRTEGKALTADAYPYAASYTGVGIVFPEWALPPADYAIVREARRDELRAHLQHRVEQRNGPGALLFGTGIYKGQRLAEVAAAQGTSFVDVLVELGPGEPSLPSATNGASSNRSCNARSMTKCAACPPPGPSSTRTSTNDVPCAAATSASRCPL